MKTEEIKAFLLAAGWKEDAYGHMKKGIMHTPKLTEDEPNPVEREVIHRIKFQKLSVRFEKQYTIPETNFTRASKAWSLRCSAYHKDIKLDNDGRLIIGRYRFRLTGV